jgi:flavin-dependent dehydrogenase
MSNQLDVDVVVIGAGPAGATAAGLLASWGHSVALIHGESDAPSLAESLPASTRKLLRFLGQLEAIDAQSFHPNHGNISRWAEKEAVAATDIAGYHVSRTAFDRVLREHASACGATRINAHVRRVAFDGPIVVECVAAEGVCRCSGRFLLDCSGRAGVVARRGLRRADAGYRTLAVTAEWTTDDWPMNERTHTVIDSYEHGWAWSVPLSPSRRQCTVMIDADRTTVRKTSLERLYVEELHRARSIDSRLAGAVRTGPIWACDASIYDSVRAFDGNALLVGDAASFVEALSSGGVKKALSSAWNAAVVVNTCLTKPSMQPQALEFFDRRERQVYGEYLRQSAAFFRQAALVYDQPFWTSRASAADRVDEDNAPSDFDLVHDGDVRLTFEQLRDAPRLGFAPGPHLQFAQAAVIEEREVVLRDGVVIPGFRTPIRFAAGVNLPELARIAPDCRDVPTLLTAYERRVATVDPRDLLVGLSFLVTRGVISRA